MGRWRSGGASCDAYAAMHCEACGQENIDGARFCAKCGALLPVEEHKEDPLIGQVIGGRYRITGVLGEGGMGIVYVAEQQMGSTLRKVAVKTLHPHLSQDPSVLARFHRECGTVAQLEHPNTIKFYDFGATADGTLYIAMEFVKGKSLMDVIEEGPIAPARTLKIMKQVCGALDEAHKLGIIHRDLKPENIILTDRAGETDFVKVLDFGIAARTESSDAQKEQKLTQQGMVLGTPPYMSPEQFTGKELDARSDIYSLGVMSYEMLTGRLPFEADTPWQWATQHMTAQPIPFDAAPSSSSSVPESMRSAIMRALSKEKEQRQTTARQFFEELSGGGGITVDAPAASGPVSLGSAGTAAMPAAPDFAAMGAAAAPAVAAAQPTPGGPPPVAANLPPPPPPARGGGGGGKGLVIGLGGLGLVLLIAIVIVVARGMKPSETDQALANPFSSSSSGATTIAPQVDSAGETATTQATGTAPEDTSTAPQPTHTTTQAHTAAPTHPTATSKPTATAKPPAAGGAQACAACIAAAQGGNISGAAANYSRCNNASAKQRCAAFARAKAPAAARAAAFNGRCPQAKAIAGAARAMGAGSGALNAAVKTCK